ncbi:MAG: sulfatase-like hydrolase/transferase [Roseburia sp.]|nr:sulfatase-like hydrolase/transferase [Anaeroplasma bactoclasticum]MCM1196288.1 sulfatase-like hydrolase/transferase [Roseburia sp.]
MKKRPFLWITILFFVLNIFNTYFLTLASFNQYIIPFNHSFLSEVCSIIGNFAILGIFYLIGILFFKKPRKIAIYLTSLTFILNVAIIALQYYMKSYKLAFSVFNFSLMKSPTGGFGGKVFLDWIYELFLYYRILTLIPFVAMLLLLIVFRKHFLNIKIQVSFQKIFCSFAVLFGCSIGTYGYYQYSLDKNWGFSTDYAQYGCQYAGAYNYYISEFIFRVDNRAIDKDANVTEELRELSEYNKNKASYVNAIDHKTYSNKDKQTGILKGKNIFVIQMESTMSFCYQKSFNGIEVTPNFNKLFKDQNCFYFNNVYTTVGIGNTSDAEFAFFTGLYPTGDMTIAWEFDSYDFQITALGDHFNDYLSYSYNPTNESFYNHNNLHEQLYKVTDFRGLETFESLYPKKENKEKYLNYWISDASILNWAAETQLEANQKGKNALSFVETITPHNPFYDMSEDLPNFTNYDYGISSSYYQLTNYINQVKYNDTMLWNFLNDVTNEKSPNYLKDTIFILYGDHGNALYRGAYESLFDYELDDLEYRKLLLNIPVIVYDPTGKIYESMDQQEIETILSQTKSNTDMYRTLINLFGIETDQAYYGVNMFSGEPSFSYDPKNLDIITDDFMYCKKNEQFEIYNGNQIRMDLVEYILDFKKKQDSYLNTLVYTSDKKK